MSNPKEPEHYTQFAIEPIEIIQRNKLSYEQGNVVKYIHRYKQKDGARDLLKAIKYIELILAHEYGYEKENGVLYAPNVLTPSQVPWHTHHKKDLVEETLDTESSFRLVDDPIPPYGYK